MGKVTLLAGGTGGAKLARGMLDVVGSELTVIANTGDDLEIYGAYVSPDPDLICFWLADCIDERGWGLVGDTFETMQGFRDIGVDIWFNLGDRDLAISLERKRLLDEGITLTKAIAQLTKTLGIPAAVLPVSNTPIRTEVRTSTGWLSFQEYMIKGQNQGSIENVNFDRIDQAELTSEVKSAIDQADVIVIGPSNPIVSIGPILAVSEMQAALKQTGAPVVAVSPIVGGKVLKGPTAPFMRWAGHEPTAAGVAAFYGEVINGIVADEKVETHASLNTDLLLDSPDARRRLAQETLEFAASL